MGKGRKRTIHISIVKPGWTIAGRGREKLKGKLFQHATKSPEDALLSLHQQITHARTPASTQNCVFFFDSPRYGKC